MQAWLITGFTILVVYLLDRSQPRVLRGVFEWVPAILLAYLIPAAICGMLDLDLSNDHVHDLSKDYLIPMAIVTVMSSMSFLQLKSIGWRPILVFVSGSFWIALFPVLVMALLPASLEEALLTKEFWKAMPPIVGSWIGGSTSMLVLKELVECPEQIFLIILVVDNILVNLWTIGMFQTIKRSDQWNRLLGLDATRMPDDIQLSSDAPRHWLIPLLILLASVFVCQLLFESFIVKILVLSALGLLASNLLTRWPFDFVLKLATLLILAIMAVLGLKLRFESIDVESGFLTLLVIWLIGHFLIMLATARILRVNLAWVPIASMANVGGIATAPAVTSAYKPAWMPHAVVLAILSMVTGTIWGMLTIYLMKLMM